jgi:hypothetical protein
MTKESPYQIRRSEDRGGANLDWLTAKHSFSFAEYQDPKHIRFRTMRVLNEDRIAPQKGFPMHPHENMEIITYLLSGSLKHQDSMGNSALIRPDEVQRMSAGTGVVHSETNPSDEETHLFQIWIFPEKNGLSPSYEQKQIPKELRANKLCLIASNAPDEHAVKIHQDASVYVADLSGGKSLTYESKSERHVWIQLAVGELDINGYSINAGDGLAISPSSLLKISALTNSKFLLFDLK